MNREEAMAAYAADPANALRNANLSDVDLGDVDLRGADLSGADLSGADLSGADLRGADLSDVDLSGAYLRGAYLRNANLSDANLSDVDLSGAYLRGADLRGADLRGARGLASLQITPAGALVGWKKVRGGEIVELAIPRGAARVNAYGSRKCRAEYAVVVAAPPGATSLYDSATKYVVGATVRPDSYDPDPRVECSHGIHFFLTREEAEEYPA
jgi:hypothetical protein